MRSMRETIMGFCRGPQGTYIRHVRGDIIDILFVQKSRACFRVSNFVLWWRNLEQLDYYFDRDSTWQGYGQEWFVVARFTFDIPLHL